MINHVPAHRTIAYFSMEVGLEAALPTYAGGLGVLAGDTIRAAADLAVPMVAVTLVHRHGYFRQRVDAVGVQREEPTVWPVEQLLRELPARVTVHVEGHAVALRAWELVVRGASGFEVPVYFLDAHLPENAPADRRLTDDLYRGDMRHRLAQEMLLGIGGVRMLRALGHGQLQRYHMNEGHSALLSLELLDETMRAAGHPAPTHDDVQAVRERCVFTTHTPVAAGHDQFPLDLVERVLGRSDLAAMKEVFCCEGRLNMTFLALNLSHYVNGVARQHGETARHMFAGHAIDYITNGVHAATWAAPAFAALYDRYIPDWRLQNHSLRTAIALPTEAVWDAHMVAKTDLLAWLENERGVHLDRECFTLGFARRATAYKRLDLVFSDLPRLKEIARRAGRIQVVCGGKAHPMDEGGKDVIRRLSGAARALGTALPVVYVDDYDLSCARTLVAGVDVWLNTPEPPQEASGTSGMKAAVNGVPSFSILDGWWIEGCIEDFTGWAIGSPTRGDADALYTKLEQAVLPTFYGDRSRYVQMMRSTIALNASFFNTHRMLMQYVLKAYME